MKKTLITTASLLLTQAFAQGVPSTNTAMPIIIQSAPSTSSASVKLPETPELKKTVNLTVPMGGMNLESALTLIAKSAGMTILTQGVPNVQLRTGLQNVTAGKAIETLLNLYAPGVNATAQGKVLIIGQESAIKRVQGVLSEQRSADSTADLELVQVAGLSAEQFGRIQSLLSGKTVFFDTGRILVSGTAGQIAQSKKTLRALPTSETPAAINTPTQSQIFTVEDNGAAIASAVKDLTGASVITVGNRLIVKGTANQLTETTRLLSGLTNKPAQQNSETTVKRSYDSFSPSADKALLDALLNVKVTVLDAQKLLIVEATEAQHKAATTILNTQRIREAQRNISYYPVTGKASDLVPVLRRELPNSDIQVVEGRNILSVQGTPQEQAKAADILTKLQSGEDTNTNELITRSIKLGYTEADTLSSSLSGLKLLSAATTTTPGLQVASLNGQGQGQSSVNVFADKRTNSLILTGPRAQVEEMSRAIASIDVPEKTVRVRLRVEQVNANDIGKLGINWSLGLGGVTVGQNDGTLSVGYSPSLTPASISAALNTAKTKGNNKTIIDSNFAAISGQETNFQSGGELLFPAQTNVVNGQTVTTPGQTYGYGLSIKVRPRIAPDGTVVMTLSTDLGSTPASGPQSSIQQTKQTMQSTVMIKKGDTVVLGGIITDTNDVSSKGVPGLMDIPVLGSLFGTKTNTSTNQALLFIVSAEEVMTQPVTQGANGTQRVELPASPTPTAMPAMTEVPDNASEAPATPSAATETDQNTQPQTDAGVNKP